MYKKTAIGSTSSAKLLTVLTVLKSFFFGKNARAWKIHVTRVV